MHVVAVQHEIVPEDKPANHATVERLLSQAPPPANSYILLPELGDTGFYFNLDTIVDDQTLPWARGLAKKYRSWVQPGNAARVEDADPPGRNCASIIAPGGDIAATYQKIHPFSYGREAEVFSGGDRLVLRRVDDAIVCPLICYDLRFSELFRIAALHGADVFMIGAIWPKDRQMHWKTLLRARAIENQAFVVGVNRAGRDSRLAYAGGSMIISPFGDILAEAEDGERVLTADLDLNSLRQWREKFPALKDMHSELLGSIEIDTDAATPVLHKHASPDVLPARE